MNDLKTEIILSLPNVSAVGFFEVDLCLFSTVTSHEILKIGLR